MPFHTALKYLFKKIKISFAECQIRWHSAKNKFFKKTKKYRLCRVPHGEAFDKENQKTINKRTLCRVPDQVALGKE